MELRRVQSEGLILFCGRESAGISKAYMAWKTSCSARRFTLTLELPAHIVWSILLANLIKIQIIKFANKMGHTVKKRAKVGVLRRLWHLNKIHRKCWSWRKTPCRARSFSCGVCFAFRWNGASLEAKRRLVVDFFLRLQEQECKNTRSVPD